MRILAIDTSSVTCSAALCEDETLLAQSFQNSGLTHSQTLMPILEDMLKHCAQRLDTVDLMAVAAGPGSFTGLRIGVSALKGLAWAEGKPCVACSTLESIAWQLAHCKGEICAVLDARRAQVYAARFYADGTGIKRLTPDRAIAMEALAAELRQENAMPLLAGDGAVMCETALRGCGLDVTIAPPHLRYATAWGVARCALALAHAGRLTDAHTLAPVYHRLSQAERERQRRINEEKRGSNNESECDHD
ncbi:MAG: tRNA (adenosine(37)-N6)-threonylcarbamoyltransferase complex dimerization subunit type 1 TsaB [Oscillospiraceae bacterium]|nr:tRNA (adenosine(37)-N6)-threonylcarbamoyltransferase complex dimerization subunit type 1 TsaB [Oscillospiraceae bacterium]